MRQLLQNYRSGKLQVSDLPAPALGTGGLLVATQNSLISAGTERSSAQMARKSLLGKAIARPDLVSKVLAQVEKKGLRETLRLALSRLDSPVAPGYSAAGTVLEVGEEVSGYRVGDRVACAGQNFASHSEVIFVPKNLCVPIPEGVSFEAASFVALGAIALQGIRQADARLGENVAVIGLGLLGQLTVQMLIANGCTVVGTDLDPNKLELARRCGARVAAPAQLSECVAALSGGHGADAVIVTASTSDDGPVAAAADACRKRGRVVVVGAVGMNLPREPYYRKEIDFRLSTSYGPGRYDADYEERGRDYPFAYVRWTEQRNMAAFLQLVAAGRVDTSTLTTHRFPIEQAGQAYELILEGTEPYLGVLLQYPRAPEARLARTVTLHARPAVGNLRLGIIGAGNHVNDALLPALRDRAGVEIRAVCTATGMKARDRAGHLRAAYCTSDAHALLADADINAVLIGTRHDSHASLVLQALAAGKHVFVEKPLCLTEGELEEILAACRRGASAGQLLMVGFNRRFSAHAAALRAAFADRGNPLVMSYRVNAGPIDPQHWIQDPKIGGGRLIGEGCHFLDLMQYVSGAQMSAVQAMTIGTHTSGIASDQVIVSAEFTDGSIGTLTYAAGGDPRLGKERFEVFGSGRAAVLDDFRCTELFARGRRRRLRSRGQDKGFAGEIAAFCDSVLRGSALPISLEDIEAVTRGTLLAARGLTTRERYPVELTSLTPR